MSLSMKGFQWVSGQAGHYKNISKSEHGAPRKKRFPLRTEHVAKCVEIAQLRWCLNRCVLVTQAFHRIMAALHALLFWGLMTEAT